MEIITFKKKIIIPQNNEDNITINNHPIIVKHPATSGVKALQMKDGKDDSLKAKILYL